MYKLQEMPWIEYSNKIFDLELENYHKASELISFLKNLFDGQKYTDKYGNDIQLKSLNDKLDFIEALSSDHAFRDCIKHKFSVNEQNLIRILLEL